MNEPMISVIVPVYNREKTIGKCLNGILAIKNSDIEVIVIDDGSTDLSLQVLKDYEKQDNRIKIIYKENNGVSAARNSGLSIANGKWILFVDSDDTIYADIIKLVIEAEKNHSDFVMFKRKCVSDIESSIERKIDLNNTTKILTGNSEIINYIFGEFEPEKNGYYFVHTKLFKNSIIKKNNIKFDENVSLGEDQIFICDYLKYVQTLLICQTVFSVELIWNKLERNYSLGGKLRTPEDFLENQIKNYNAINSLYVFSGQHLVKKYALHYISDRPISRILIRYTERKNRKLYSYEKLKTFFLQNVTPLFCSLDEKEINNTILSVRGGYMFSAIRNGNFFSAYICAWMISIRMNFILLIKKVIKKLLYVLFPKMYWRFCRG